MFRRQANTCSECNGTNIRRSRWLSHDEKVSNSGMQPVRCNNCGHRFLAPRPKPVSTRVLVLAATAVVVVLSLFIAFGHRMSLPKKTGGGAVATSDRIEIDTDDLRAADSGNPDAQFKVANLLLAKPGVGLDNSSKAIGYLEAAAEKGHLPSMLRVGALYRKGIGALQNYALAAKWIGRAALRGSPQGMLELGRLHRDGIGMPADPVQAYVWFNRAAAANNPEAPLERQAVARLLSPEDLQRAQEESAKPVAVAGS